MRKTSYLFCFFALIISSFALAGAGKDSKFLIPKKLHFVWMGGKLPQKYINNIRSFVSRNPDYVANLWLDRRSNFEVSNVLQDAGDLPLVFRSFDEIVGHLPAKLRDYFERERNGVFLNYAAASDILRVQILLEEGGIYFDTDVFMQETTSLDVAVSDFKNNNNSFKKESLSPEKIEEDEKLQEWIKRIYREASEFTGVLVHLHTLIRPISTCDSSSDPVEKPRKIDNKLQEAMLTAPISQLGDIYAPFGFLFRVKTVLKAQGRSSGKLMDIRLPSPRRLIASSRPTSTAMKGVNNNVMAAVQGSHFLKLMQEQMIAKFDHLEKRLAHKVSKSQDGCMKKWNKNLWVSKRYSPRSNCRFNMTIHITGPEAVRTAANDVYAYLESLPSEEVDLIVEHFPNLVLETGENYKLFNKTSFIHSKYLFLELDQLLIHGFNFNLPGFQSKCDNSWTQDKVRLKDKIPAEYH